MPLNPTKLAANLTDIDMEVQGAEVEPDVKQRIQQKNQKIAMAIDAYIRQATVNVTVAPGTPVATAGSPAAQTGVTTGPGTGVGSIT